MSFDNDILLQLLRSRSEARYQRRYHVPAFLTMFQALMGLKGEGLYSYFCAFIYNIPLYTHVRAENGIPFESLYYLRCLQIP